MAVTSTGFRTYTIVSDSSPFVAAAWCGIARAITPEAEDAINDSAPRATKHARPKRKLDDLVAGVSADILLLLERAQAGLDKVSTDLMITAEKLKTDEKGRYS